MVYAPRLSPCSALALVWLLTAASAPAQTLGPNILPEPVFRPVDFFVGHTEGIGRLKIMFGRHRLVFVHGVGWLKPDGTLMLDQDIEQAGKPLKHRRWEMRTLGNGRYEATLSDATGPVIGAVRGNVLKLAFPAKGGLRIKQVLILATDGRTVANRLTIRKMGSVESLCRRQYLADF